MPHLNVYLPCYAPKGRVFYASSSITETSNRAVVGPACKLLLHCLREHWAIDERVSRRFGRKVNVKVCCVQCIGLPESVILLMKVVNARYIPHLV